MDNLQSTTALQTCKNCGVEGQHTYCGYCGESQSTHRLTIGHMLHEVVHLFTHFDHGFLYTLKQLVINPGGMQKEYIEGKRKHHQKPFSMMFVCGTASAIALFWITKWAAHIFHSEVNTKEQYFYQHYFVMLQMALVPVYALINRLAYYKSKYNYAEFLVILLYNTSVILLILIVANSIKLAIGLVETGFAEMSLVVIYNMFTFFNIFNADSKWVVALKVLLTSALCFTVSRLAMEFFMSTFMAGHH